MAPYIRVDKIKRILRHKLIGKELKMFAKLATYTIESTTTISRT